MHNARSMHAQARAGQEEEEEERGGGRRDGVLCPFMCARRPARTTPATAGWSAGH